MNSETPSTDRHWLRVDESSRCPICKKPDWCGISSQGTAAICMRVSSDKLTRNNGWLHLLSDPIPHVNLPPKRNRIPPPDFDELNDACVMEGRHRSPIVERFAKSIGVSYSTLLRFEVGLHGNVLTVPMRHPDGTICGMRYRSLATGKKWAEPGSRNGLFIPENLMRDGPLHITEGETDAFAAFDQGLEAVGRPGCRGAVDLLFPLSRGGDLVVWADNDDSGIGGANECTARLQLVATSVRLVRPPLAHKDLRAWIVAGHATRKQIDALVAASPVLQAEVCTGEES